MGTYRIIPEGSKFRFALHDGGDVVLLTSVEHATLAKAKEGIEAVRVQARYEGNYHPSGSAKKWTFDLKQGATLLGSGKVHATETKRHAAIESTKIHAPNSPVEESVVA